MIRNLEEVTAVRAVTKTPHDRFSTQGHLDRRTITFDLVVIRQRNFSFGFTSGCIERFQLGVSFQVQSRSPWYGFETRQPEQQLSLLAALHTARKQRIRIVANGHKGPIGILWLYPRVPLECVTLLCSLDPGRPALLASLLVSLLSRMQPIREFRIQKLRNP
jgi:hypothetical protein